MQLEYPYKKILADGSQEDAKLIIDTRIGKISEHEDINNPTDDENAFFYALSIDGGMWQIQAFQPGEE